MKIGNLVIQWIRLPKPLETLKFISGKLVATKLFQAHPNANIYIADSKYRLFNTKDLMTVFATHRFNEMPYIPEDRDCDDYSWSFIGQMKKLIPGCTIGKVWADFLKTDGTINYKHAFCWFINENGKLMYIEPQTNKIFTPKKNIKPYLFIT